MDSAAACYGGPELRISEQRRDARLGELRRKFVDGPVLVLTAREILFVHHREPGTMYPNFRGNGDWGSVEAAAVVVSEDRQMLIPSAPATTGATGAAGDGWVTWLEVRRGKQSGRLQIEAGK